MRTLIITTALFLIISLHLSAQEEALLTTVYNIANNISTEAGSDNAEILAEMLLELAFNPVRINMGNANETERLFFLTPFQVLSLVNHVNRTGPVISVYEIATLPGFTRELAITISPFITLENTFVSKSPGNYGKPRQRIVVSSSLRLLDGTVDPQQYPLKRSMRYRFESGNFTAVATTAGDASEAPINFERGPDFISGGVLVQGDRVVKNLVIGDFTARSGLGLTLNSGYKPYLSLTSSSFMGQRDGFTVYSSVNEANYLRGAATTFAIQKVEASIFISSRQRDARLKYDADSSMYADILASAPIHNSFSSMTARAVLTETSGGMFIGIGTGSFQGAVSAAYTSFSETVIESSGEPSGLFSLSGKETWNAGASYRFTAGRLSAAGELAFSRGGGTATAHTANIRCDDRLNVNVVYRNYSRKYYGHLAGGPGRNTYTTNEQGLMIRLNYEAARRLFLSGGADVYRFPWLKESASFPSYGSRYELKASYQLSEKLTTEALISGAQSLQNGSRPSMVPSAAVKEQRTGRLMVMLKPATTLTIRTNIIIKSAGGGTNGTMLAADCSYSPAWAPLTLWFRHAIFSTDNFENALYLYENDLLYSFSVPSHNGEGSRTAAVISVALGKNADLRLKYAISSKPLQESTKTHEEVKGQLSWRF